MISIPLYIFLILYALYLLIFALFFTINFFHLFHTGGATKFSFIFSLVMMVISILILICTWYYVGDVDWGIKLNIGSGANSTQNINIFDTQF